MATTRLCTLEGDLPGARLRSATGCTSEVYRHGAHVASWRDAAGEDIIFLSSEAVFKPPKAIRGGIPLCFPQFSDLGPLAQQHGFARNEQWQLVDPPADGDEDGGNVTMRLVSSDATKALWPHDFVATFETRLDGDEMHTSLTVRNTGSEPFEFTVALHTYFTVGDIGKATVEGLRGASYLDSLDGRIRRLTKTKPSRSRVKWTASTRTRTTF
jgi:glucose-6-phosphate 1-epimerase